ncbi:cysteine-rich CWC family protein [Polynucleobacter sinensis]|uniref:cysteine-rich CWC family protein n=1 Tax=Polynucleobacter sinensis TaxID=1743157 RepID=UPI00387EA026
MICPACGSANNCQISADKMCWCFDVPVDKAKLEQVIKDKSKDQCLCRACLSKLSVQLQDA